MSVLTMNRPAKLMSDEQRLDDEYRSARWLHHRLLDFEDDHQRVIEAAAEAIVPGIIRAGRIVARLARRAERRKRTTSGQWSPDPRPDLAARLKKILDVMRETRNADPRWKAALGWADERVGEPAVPRRRRARDADKIKRRKNESDEAWNKRLALVTSDETDEHYAKKVADGKRRTRREQYRVELYAQRRVFHGTYNALCESVDQARRAVLERRTQGLPADWRRPKFRDHASLSAATGGFRIVERGPLWWTIDMRIGVAKGKAAEWVRVRAKFGNWHAVPDDASFLTAKLTRRRDGMRWRYSLSIAVTGVDKEQSVPWATTGRVAFDWGHREYGHPSADLGLRAFVWEGDDGRRGQILLPAECRRVTDEIDALKARIADAFNARRRAHKLPDRNRHAYRRRLLLQEERTAEEDLWLSWEVRYERRIARRRRRRENLRRETYVVAVRELRSMYATFAFEDDDNASIKRQQQDEQMRRRKRANRDMTARYDFVELCERFGAEVIVVSARNTTRECPECGHLDENTAELLMACLGCGTVRDKDYGAARVILRRAEEVLAGHAAE